MLITFYIYQKLRRKTVQKMHYLNGADYRLQLPPLQSPLFKR